MADKSPIQWTDATWNPSTGCTKVSPGCKNCYAERLSKRLRRMGNEKYKRGFHFTLHRDAIEIPLGWRRPRKIFVNSMSDLFHPSMPNKFLDRCFQVMENANWHVYQILTKRPEAMCSFVEKRGGVPDHIWLGTSVELAMYKSRIEILRRTKARIKFVSFEPLLGPIGHVDLAGISWAIVGGESGLDHRPIKPEWVREIQMQCKRNGTAFFFKQWGGNTAKSGGRRLDGQEWSEYPLQVHSNMELPLAPLAT